MSFQNISYAKIQDKTVINAILSDNMADLQEILENGADPDARGDYGITALMVSINKYNDAAAEYLIKKGADVNASDIAGVTPLHLASRNGNMAMIKLLIENGADIKAKDKHGYNALYKAKLAGKENAVQYLSDLTPQSDSKQAIKAVTKT
jgi:ankyrin repeat protein